MRNRLTDAIDEVNNNDMDGIIAQLKAAVANNDPDAVNGCALALWQCARDCCVLGGRANFTSDGLDGALVHAAMLYGNAINCKPNKWRTTKRASELHRQGQVYQAARRVAVNLEI